MPGLEALNQLSQIDALSKAHAPKSNEIGGKHTLGGYLTGTNYPGHRVPLHLTPEATAQVKVAQALLERKRG